MKRNQFIRPAIIAASVFATVAATAQENPATNRLTFSARFGLNISAKFSGATPIAVPPSSRPIPDRPETYNYDDGFVHPDVSGSGDGYTWFWGYDDSNTQLDAGANRILMHQSAGPATLRSPGMDDGLSPGCELTYTRELGAGQDFRYGFEAAVNYLSIGMNARGSYALQGTRNTYAFGYTPGTTPPTATPGNEYLGTYDGPGFVIGTDGTLVDTSAATVGTVTGGRSLDADLWGGRLGPYLEYYLDDNVSVSLSGGLAVGWLDASVAWNETVQFNSGATLSDAGRGDDQAFLWGGYAAANLNWRLSERWSAAASAQFQSLGTYQKTFGTRKAELDLSSSFFFTVGLGYNF